MLKGFLQAFWVLLTWGFMTKNYVNNKHLKNRLNEINAWLLVFISFWVVDVFPVGAFAQTTGATNGGSKLGDVICNIADNLEPYIEFVIAVAYLIGAFLLANGIIMLKKYSEGASGATVSGGVLRLIAGSGSLSLPVFAGLVQASVVGNATANGLSGCVGGPVASATDGGLDVLVNNLISNIQSPMQIVLSILCVVMGVFMIAKGLLRASKYGSDQRSTIPSIAANLIIGAVLISAGEMMGVVVASVTGVTSSSDAAQSFKTSGLNWAKFTEEDGDYTKINTAVQSVLTFVQIIGMIAFIRGWMVVKTTVEGGQGSIAQGITHIIGGAMAINIHTMLEVFDNTFGLDVVKN